VTSKWHVVWYITAYDKLRAVCSGSLFAAEITVLERRKSRFAQSIIAVVLNGVML
jgi:hypothetical protein